MWSEYGSAWRACLAGAVATLGCSHSYQLSHPVAVRATAQLERSASAYVARPQNGTYGTRTYPQSAEQTVAVLAGAFGKRLPRVVIADSVEPYEVALTTARTGGHRYLVFPEIKHWEDRATEWSGRPDRMRVRLTIFDTETGTMIDSVEIQGQSRWATFGGDHPQELLPKPVEEYVASLFGEP